MMRKKRLKEIIRLQGILIDKLKPYYAEREGAWIEEWYDALTTRIAELKK